MARKSESASMLIGSTAAKTLRINLAHHARQGEMSKGIERMGGIAGTCVLNLGRDDAGTFKLRFDCPGCDVAMECVPNGEGDYVLTATETSHDHLMGSCMDYSRLVQFARDCSPLAFTRTQTHVRGVESCVERIAKGCDMTVHGNVPGETMMFTGAVEGHIDTAMNVLGPRFVVVEGDGKRATYADAIKDVSRRAAEVSYYVPGRFDGANEAVMADRKRAYVENMKEELAPWRDRPEEAPWGELAMRDLGEAVLASESDLDVMLGRRYEAGMHCVRFLGAFGIGEEDAYDVPVIVNGMWTADLEEAIPTKAERERDLAAEKEAFAMFDERPMLDTSTLRCAQGAEMHMTPDW